jgi:outer membrane protein with beta-barrel domain
MKVFRSLQLAALFVLATTSVVAAQALPTHTWSHGTTINLFTGVAAASSNAGVAAGGAAGWEITKLFGIEGLAEWLDRPQGEEGFDVSLTGHVNFTGARPLVPFAKVGVGFYRATFDGTATDIPEFYQERITPANSALGTRQTFTDPSFVLGGGLNVFVSRHWAIRPDAGVTIVRDHGASHVVTGVTVHAAYHFEDHPVTPATSGK